MPDLVTEFVNNFTTRTQIVYCEDLFNFRKI